MYEIVDLQGLLRDYLGDREVISHQITNLTAPGDNYGSLMLKLDLTVKNRKTGEVQTIHAVAKTPPPNEELKKYFNTVVTFKNEIGFYREIFPELQKIQRKYRLKPATYFPEFLGGRFNLDGGEMVDDNAALVLENLVTKGFVTEDRLKGFDFETTKMIVRDLANLHATAIAVKIQTPDVFQRKIRCFLDGVDEKEDQQFVDDVRDGLSNILLEHESLRVFQPKVLKIFKTPNEYRVKEPFATISHQDLWVNNTMVKYENGKPLENKFVDFQVCRYHSALSDVIFLLLTSVQDEVIKEKFDFFLEFYYKEFIGTLEQLQCDVKPFSWEAFQEEILYAKNDQIRRSLCMMFPVFMDKSQAVDLKDLKFENEPIYTTASTRHIEKLEVVLNILDLKGWLD